MAVVPALPAVPSGGTYTSSQVSQLVAVSAFLLAPPIAELRQTSVQSIPNNAVTAVLLDTEDVDSADGHSTSVDTSRYTAVYAGWYEIGGGISFAANATGFRAAQAYVNGSPLNGSATYAMPSAATNTVMALRPKKIYLNVGDYAEVMAYQTSGGALNTSITSTEQCTMTIRRVSN